MNRLPVAVIVQIVLFDVGLDVIAAHHAIYGVMVVNPLVVASFALAHDRGVHRVEHVLEVAHLEGAGGRCVRALREAHVSRGPGSIPQVAAFAVGLAVHRQRRRRLHSVDIELVERVEIRGRTPNGNDCKNVRVARRRRIASPQRLARSAGC